MGLECHKDILCSLARVRNQRHGVGFSIGGCCIKKAQRLVMLGGHIEHRETFLQLLLQDSAVNRFRLQRQHT